MAAAEAVAATETADAVGGEASDRKEAGVDVTRDDDCLGVDPGEETVVVNVGVA